MNTSPNYPSPEEFAVLEAEARQELAALQAAAPEEFTNLKIALAAVCAADQGDAVFGPSRSPERTRDAFARAFAALATAAPNEYRELCAAVVIASSDNVHTCAVNSLNELKAAAPAECASLEAANQAYRNGRGSRRAIDAATAALEAAAPQEYAEFVRANNASKADYDRKRGGFFGRLFASYRQMRN